MGNKYVKSVSFKGKDVIPNFVVPQFLRNSENMKFEMDPKGENRMEDGLDIIYVRGK